LKEIFVQINLNKIYKGRLRSIFLLAAMIFSIPVVLADNKPVMPFTASELPVMATTPNLIYGASGPQINLDAPGFKSIPQPIYINKELEAQLTQESDTDIISDKVMSSLFEQLTIDYNPLLRKERQVVLQKGLSFQNVQEIARKELLQCQDTGYVCDAVISRKDNGLNLALTPLLIESVQVEGEGERQKKALTSLLRWIHPNQPLKLHDAQRQLRLLQSNPDLPFSAELEVMPYSHQIQIKVLSTEAKNPSHVSASWNNLDQPIFGRQFGAMTEVHNNLTGHGDSLMTSIVQGYRSTGFFSHYEYPVTPALRPFVEASIAKISPFQSLYTDGDTHGWATRITTGLKYVIYDRPNRRLSADVDFDFKQAYSRAHGGNTPLEREAVRTFRGGINYDQKWKTAVLSTRHEFAGGVPIFSGSLSDDPKLSWYKGGSQYFRYTGYAILTKQLPLDSTATLNTQWQFTPNGLSNFDVGGLGGTFYGRGYREVYLFVDNYTITSLQWQAPARFLPKGLKLPFSGKAIRDTLSLLAFLDYGYGKISSPTKGIAPDYQILSTGLGVRAQLSNRTSGRLDIGFPILRESPFSQKPRVHFGLDIALF
jgi:hemolysin activation/secretion protein